MRRAVFLFKQCIWVSTRCLVIFLLSSILLDAGDNFIEVKGIILDSKSKPVPYIIVSFDKTNDTTLNIKSMSGIDGAFILRVPSNTKFPFKISFNSVNYVSKNLIITKTNYKKVQRIKLASKENYQLAYEKKRKLEKAKYNKEKRKLSGKKGKVEFATTDVVDRASRDDLDDSPTDITFKKKSVSEFNSKTINVACPPSPDYAKDMEATIISRPGLPNPINEPQVEAGKLTAGELNDFAKWKLWEDITSTNLGIYQKTWKIYPNERYVAQLTNPDGMAIVNAKVVLKDKDGNNIWQSYTDNTGKAELWAKMLNDSLPNVGTPYYIEFEYQTQKIRIEAVPFYVRINTAEMNIKCNDVNAVDIDFVVDATGSMGDEIKYLQAELYDVIKKVQANNSHIDLRTSSIFYRDFGDEYVIRKSDFNKDINKTIDFIKEQGAAGGGDYAEAIDVALYESIENRDWRENALSKIIFLVLDAPPHEVDSCIKQIQRQIRIAAMKGIRIVPLVCSGTDKSTEYLMRSIALATNGTYVFLTDESGIGDSHIKPTTDKYEVEKLNHILLRIITEFATLPNCNNDWVNNFDSTINDFDKYLPKPYKDNPDFTERVDISAVLSVYPTPCNGKLNVDVLQNISHLYLSDITGKILQNFEDVPKSFYINMNGYSNGIYFINVYYGGRWYSLKFVLSK
jgi:hypothetical protein